MSCFIAVIAVAGAFGTHIEERHVNRDLIAVIEEVDVPKNSRYVIMNNNYGSFRTPMTQKEIVFLPCVK